jgi:hypothetical protein
METDRIPENIEQAAQLISRDLQGVMERETVYTKNEFYILLHPFCKPFIFPVHEVAQALVQLKIIWVYLKGNDKSYSLMPTKGLDELDKSTFQLFEVKTWLAKSRNEENM